MLRPYQKELIEKARMKLREGAKRLVIVLPTGGGKTFTFCSMLKAANDRNRKCLILTDRIELLKQAGGALRAFDLHPIDIKAGSKPYLGGYLYTAMVETLFRRLSKPDYQYWLKQMDIVVIDECHIRTFDKLFPFLNPETRVLGFTATPRRMGRKDMMGDFYDDLVIGTDIPDLISDGYLAKPEYFGVKADLGGVRTVRGDYDVNQVAERFSKSKVYAGVVSNWERIAKGTKTLIFSSTVASSKEVVSEFVRAGIDARHLDSKGGGRAETLKWFASTPGAILSNVGLFTKGFDEPSISTIVLYRATKSLPLYLQMVGRGSRPLPDKAGFHILDFGNNIATHGFWHDKRDWRLMLSDDQERPKGEAILKNCDGCEAFIPASTVTCPHCGFVHQKEKEKQEVAMLQKLSPKEAREKAIGGTIEDMVKMVKLKTVKPHYLFHNIKDFGQIKELVKGLGYSPWWIAYNHDRFWWSSEYLKEVESGLTPIQILADVG